jgi:TonB-linked SusC/RagA family outer membrane protein
LLTLKYLFMKQSDQKRKANNNLLSKMILACMLMLIASVASFAQSTKVTGTVTDEKGEPIIGASILVKGSSTGTITDIDGNFTVNAPAKAKLVVSYIGYVKQEVAVTGNKMKVSLKEDAKTLDEVVVVGYGTQKKATLTGAVSQIQGDEVLKGRATSNIGAALQGAIPGLTITRNSSRPTDNVSISIRGGISVNGSDPLVLIDGVDAYLWELNTLNPNDIESMSVLKDAAASIYGARAAGGVILVTTKRAKADKTVVTYNGSATMNYQGKDYPAATGSQWAEMMLGADYEDTNHPGGASSLWTILGFNKDAYNRVMNNEAFDWVNNGMTYRIDPLHASQPDYVYGKTWGTKHSLSIQSGSKNVKSLTSIGFSDDRSLIKVTYDGQKKYNFRNNTDYTIGKYITAQTDISYDDKIANVPTYGIGYGLQDFYIFPLYTQSGQNYYDNFGGNNVLAHLTQGGKTITNDNMLRVNGKVNVDMSFISNALKGLSLSAKGAIRQLNDNQKVQTHKIQMYSYYDVQADGSVVPSTGNGATTGSNAKLESLTESNTRALYQDYEFFLNYDRAFGKHHVSGMFGNTNELRDNYSTSAYRSSSNPVTLSDLNVYDTTTDKISSSGAYKWAYVSLISRLNYDFAGKYLLEGSWRHDGSSKLVKKQRWQDFFSASAGWRISEEGFMKDLDWLNNLKLRASWGESGNVNGIGNYEAYSGISTGTTLLGTSPAKVATAWINGITDDSRTWERVNSTNVGFDYAVLNNRLSGSFDYYWRHNDGMLISISYPSTYGGSAPSTNSGSYKTHGWEATLNWRDKIGKDFTYNVGVTVSDAKTNVDSFKGKTSINYGVNSVVQGYPMNSLFVYTTDGLFQNQAEVDAYYTQMNGNVSGSLLGSVAKGTVNELTPGCVRRVDLNGDKDITIADLKYYGDTDPHYNFGINLGASYKNFDFSCFFQGVGQQYNVRNGQMGCAFWSGWTNTNGVFLGNTWTSPNNPYYGGNSNAKYPVMSRVGNRNNWNYKQYNDINVVNNWYARCKQLSLGYSLPKSLLSKAGLSKVRVWVAGENLFDISNVKDGYDPETKSTMGTFGGVDVFASSISFGLDVTF